METNSRPAINDRRPSRKPRSFVALLTAALLALIASAAVLAPNASAVSGNPTAARPFLAETTPVLGVDLWANHPQHGTVLVVANDAGYLELYTPAGESKGVIVLSSAVRDVAVGPQYIYALGGASVTTIDKTTEQVVDSFFTPEFHTNDGIAYYSGHLYVSHGNYDKVNIYSAATGDKTGDITANGDCYLDYPAGIDIHQGSLYVAAERQSSVPVFNANSGVCEKAISVPIIGAGSTHRDISVGGSASDIYVTDSQADVVQVVSQTGIQIGTASITDPKGIWVDQSGDSFWVTSTASMKVFVYTYAKCINVAPNIVGTSYDDVLNGTDINDFIDSRDGDDTINAGLGADRICSGKGDDIVDGGAGDDLIRTGGGADTVNGGPGEDTINGQGGTDEIHGGDGDDVLDGRGAGDTIYGDGGNDVINGHNGADVMTGGTGDDFIKGQTGPDVLDGSEDDDNLVGGDGGDTFFGGSGTDRCAGNTGPDAAQTGTCEATTGIESVF